MRLSLGVGLSPSSKLRLLCCALLALTLLLGCTSDLRRQRGSIDRWVEMFNGNDFEVLLNGRMVNRARNFEVRYGQIALQSNGPRVEYRSLRIRPLDINTPTPNIRDQRPDN